MGDADFEEIVMEWSRRHGVFSAWFKNLRGITLALLLERSVHQEGSFS
ncbi:7870_t:CDS:2 [Paraglomus brasilianum]|uniref:7870_t:CDS:1 n=1 Tax=Paraglomus brasilianum TaxID=144538 RepID=A0A9N8WGJ0_9GLOM|nr:7870_t:CDS:2 [Paraglomus brasilianum]